MARGVIDWNSTEAWERMVSAIIATGVKLDLKQVAMFYGTTYDTLENRLRKVKKDAAVLKEEVASGERPAVPIKAKSEPNTPKKPKTPKKGGVDGGVANGRITKTPTKKNTIKQELSSHDRAMFGDTSASDDAATGSFDFSGDLSFVESANGLAEDDENFMGGLRF